MTIPKYPTPQRKKILENFSQSSEFGLTRSAKGVYQHLELDYLLHSHKSQPQADKNRAIRKRYKDHIALYQLMLPTGDEELINETAKIANASLVNYAHAINDEPYLYDFMLYATKALADSPITEDTIHCIYNLVAIKYADSASNVQAMKANLVEENIRRFIDEPKVLAKIFEYFPDINIFKIFKNYHKKEEYDHCIALYNTGILDDYQLLDYLHAADESHFIEVLELMSKESKTNVLEQAIKNKNEILKAKLETEIRLSEKFTTLISATTSTQRNKIER